jgi:MFS family permease
MALIGLIAERAPGSAYNLAKLLAFTIIPVFIIGPIAGVYVDRWDHRRTLFVCDILRGLLVLTIPFCFMNQESMVPIYIVVFLTFCFSRFYVPAKMSIIPELVTERNLLMANSLMTTTGMLAFVLGCALGGLLVDKLGARGGFIGDAVTFVISGILIFSIPRDLKFQLNRRSLLEQGKEILRIEKSFISEIREGWVYLRSRREIRFVINMLFILLAAAGATYVVIIVFVQQSFQSVTKDLGILAVFLGVGLFIGAIVYGKWGRMMPWYKTIFLSLIGGGLMIVAFAVAVSQYPNLMFAAALAFILGVSIGPVFIAANTIVHVVSDESMRGKVFSALEVVIHFAFLLAMLISSRLAEVVPGGAILTGVGILFALTGLIGLIRYKNGGDLAFLTKKMA